MSNNQKIFNIKNKICHGFADKLNKKTLKLTIPNGVTSIGDNTFWGYDIISVFIPNSVAKIAPGAFKECTKLKTVTFEEGSQLKEIGFRAFYGNKSLKSIAIPNSVTTIGASAFEKCEALTKLVLPKNLRKIKYLAFCDCKNLKSVTFEDLFNLEILGFGAFDGCKNLVFTINQRILNNINSFIYTSPNKH